MAAAKISSAATGANANAFAHLQAEVKQMLTAKILPFWQALRDEENGGYYGYMSFDLKVDKTAPKGCILNSRILWFFSNAAMVLKQPALLPYADHAYRFLVEKCLDAEYGGVYWAVAHNGKVLDDTKHTYNQGFAIYALSAYYRSTQNPNALALARSIYQTIEEKCTDAVGYGEAYSRRFKPVSNEKLSENGVLAEKTMNTLLHIFEAYAGLYEAAPTEEVAERLRFILAQFSQKVYNPALERQEVFFDAQMNSLIDLQSYGHDIEAAWLLDWGTSLLGDAELSKQVSAITSRLAGSVYRRAFHKNSLWNERENGVEDQTRVWWVQAEAMVGCLNEYQKHPEKTEYWDAVNKLWQYIQEYLIDPRPGSEWFWRVSDDGKPDTQKPFVEPWKCPYHNGRMCFEILRRNL